MEMLAINFVPLKTQNFQFEIFRKERINNERKPNKKFRAYNLPISSSGIDETKEYWVSFDKIDGMKPFQCSSTIDPQLSIQYLFYQLIEQCQNKIKEGDNFIIKYGMFQKIEFILKSFNEGSQTVWLTPYFLESKNLFGFLIDFKFDLKKNQVFNRQVQQLSLSLDNLYKPNASLYFDKFEKLKFFLKCYYGIVFKGSSLDFGGFVQFPFDELNNKKYLFKDDNQADLPLSGLNLYGPNQGISEKVTFYFLRTELEKEKAFKFYSALIGEKFKGDRFYKGFNQTYNVGIDNTNIKGIDTNKYYNLDLIEGIAKQLAEKHKNERVIVFAFSAKKEIMGKEKKHYLNIKYAFAKQEIPVQFIQYGTVTNDWSLKSAIANLSLATFAKLGGVPWKIKPENEDCLVIGIGQSYHKQLNNNTGGYDIKKYIAYSVLLDTSGIYQQLEVLSANSNLSKYLEDLKLNLKSVLSNKSNNYQKIAIHVPFRIKRSELNAISNAIEEVNAEIEIVVVRINTNNDFWTYNLAKNHLTPFKNTYISLSNTKYLLLLDGLSKYDSEPKKRYSGPIFVEFCYSNKDMRLIDKKSYLQDLLNLSGANWRGFNAKATPVSMYYCKIVSDYIKDFKETLDVDDLQGKFKNPWFL